MASGRGSCGKAATPRLAATVLLLRDSAGAVEVLLTRRHAGIRFLGGVWVFPGGALDPADCSPAAFGRVVPEAADRCACRLAATPGRACSRSEALGLYVAACRETFEEAGVLLAREADGRPVRPERVRALQAERAGIARRPAGFGEMLERELLFLDPSRLVSWAHWITPSSEPQRFDTAFFAVAMPAEQPVLLDARESTDHAWMTPEAALAAFGRGEMSLVSPTLVTLGEIAESFAEHGSIEAMLGAEEGRAIAPVLPKIDRGPGGVVVVMPWDPGYAATPGAGVAADIPFPPRLTRLPSRLAFGPGSPESEDRRPGRG